MLQTIQLDVYTATDGVDAIHGLHPRFVTAILSIELSPGANGGLDAHKSTVPHSNGSNHLTTAFLAQLATLTIIWSFMKPDLAVDWAGWS